MLTCFPIASFSTQASAMSSAFWADVPADNG